MEAAAHREAILVAGLGETVPLDEDPRSIPEMVLEAVEAALDDAGLGYDDIDAVVTASVDLFDGLTASNIAVTEVVGAVMKPETRIAGDALGAVVQAACQIWGGAYRTVLVAAHSKPSMAPHQGLTEWAMDPIHLQPLGVDFLTCAGLQASAVSRDDAGAEARWAETAAMRWAAARRASKDRAAAPTAEQILSSPPVATPLRRGMCAPLRDGACVVILRAGGGDQSEPAARLTGVGHDLEPHSLGDRDLTRWAGLERAVARAREVAGIDGRQAAFDLAEPSCLYAHEEELFAAAAGLGPDTPISPEGGLFAGAVPVAAGLGRLIAAARRIRGGGAVRALAHGAWGPAGQGQAVAILEGSAR